MPVTNYYTVNGEILGEKTTGSSRIDYLTDALGSVTATVNQSAQIVNTYRYKPYGKQLSKSGAGADPKFQWVGTQGYRQTGRSYSDVYVRARHYDTGAGRWTTKDPIGLSSKDLNSYAYVNSSPNLWIDPTGLYRCKSCCCCAENIDVKLLFEGEYMGRLAGHKFNVTFDMMYQEAPSTGDCTIEWWEKTNLPPILNGKLTLNPDTWGDLYGKFPNGYLFSKWNEWKNSTKPCPGRAQSLVQDSPRYDKSKTIQKNTRFLCFGIVLKSAPSCNCSKSFLFVQMAQSITVEGAAKEAKLCLSGDKLNKKCPEAEKYCGSFALWYLRIPIPF